MVSLGWAGLDPAHIWDENSSLGVSIPYTTLGQVSAHPNEAMNSNLKQLTLALHNYESAYKVFPPGTVNNSVAGSNGATTAGDDPNGHNGDGTAGIGGPWICFLLPFIEQPGLYSNFELIQSQRSEVVDWFGNATYAATPIGNSHLQAMDCPAQPWNDELMADGTDMEDLARGNYAACYGSGGYGTLQTTNPAIGGIFGNNSKVTPVQVTDGLSNTLMLSELKYRQTSSNGPSSADVRGTWGYGTMGGNTFSAQTAPNSTVADAIWGCRSMPSEGMPCVSTGDPYVNLFAAARSYHTGGINVTLGDGSGASSPAAFPSRRGRRWEPAAAMRSSALSINWPSHHLPLQTSPARMASMPPARPFRRSPRCR